MTQKKNRPAADAELVDDDQGAVGGGFGGFGRGPNTGHDEVAQAYRNQLAEHAREKARRGTESLVEAASAGLMAGALRMSEPVAEFLREAGEGFLAFLGDDEDDPE